MISDPKPLIEGEVVERRRKRPTSLRLALCEHRSIIHGHGPVFPLDFYSLPIAERRPFDDLLSFAKVIVSLAILLGPSILEGNVLAAHTKNLTGETVQSLTPGI